MNNCSITGNEGGQFGYAIQMSNGHLCMNNTTVTNNSGRDGTINGAGSMLIVNSTIIEDGAQIVELLSVVNLGRPGNHS